MTKTYTASMTRVIAAMSALVTRSRRSAATKAAVRRARSWSETSGAMVRDDNNDCKICSLSDSPGTCHEEVRRLGDILMTGAKETDLKLYFMLETGGYWRWHPSWLTGCAVN